MPNLLTILPVVMEESHSVRNTDESSSSNDSCDDDDDDCQRLEPDVPELAELNIRLSSQINEDELPQEPVSVSFYVGQKFSSFEDIKQHLKLYEEQKFVKFWRRDSKTIKNKRVNRPIKSQLKYCNITYSCIHGGKKFKARGKGKRHTS